MGGSARDGAAVAARTVYPSRSRPRRSGRGQGVGSAWTARSYAAVRRAAGRRDRRRACLFGGPVGGRQTTRDIVYRHAPSPRRSPHVPASSLPVRRVLGRIFPSGLTKNRERFFYLLFFFKPIRRRKDKHLRRYTVRKK